MYNIKINFEDILKEDINNMYKILCEINKFKINYDENNQIVPKPLNKIGKDNLLYRVTISSTERFLFREYVYIHGYADIYKFTPNALFISIGSLDFDNIKILLENLNDAFGTKFQIYNIDSITKREINIKSTDKSKK